MATRRAAAGDKDGGETIGPFDDDRYIPSLGVVLPAGKTLTVVDGKIKGGADAS